MNNYQEILINEFLDNYNTADYEVFDELTNSWVSWNETTYYTNYNDGSFPNWRNPVQEILLITLVDFKTKTPITFGSKPYTGHNPNYIYTENEKELLLKFLNHWKNNQPDVITGWNNNTFDIPYVYHRMTKVLGKDITNQLSPFNICKPCPPKSPAAKAFIKDGEDRNICIRLFGISNLDYMELFKKYGRGTYESYKLDHIAQEVLGHTKVNHDEFEQFKDFYNGNPIPDQNGNDLQQLAFQRDQFVTISEDYIKLDNQLKQLCWNKFVDYNIIDTMLITDFEEKEGMIKLHIGIAYLAKINYEDVYSPVGMWETLIFNYLNKKKTTMPLQKHGKVKESYPGAYVKDPIVGMHEWVASMDLASLYPHLIIQYNISPEMLTDVYYPDIDVDYLLAKKPLPDDGLIKTPSGWCYKKEERGFLPELMLSYYNRRKEVRKEQLKLEQELELVKKRLSEI